MNLEQNLKSLENLLNEQIAKIASKGDITPTELENMTKTLCLLEKIKEYTEGPTFMVDEEGHSQYIPRSYARDNGTSDRMPNVYPANSYNYRSNRRSYGHDRGYSGHSIKDRMVAKLESMYDEAQSDHERQIVDEWIDRLNTSN